MTPREPSTNPLLEQIPPTPSYARIAPPHIEAAIRALVDEADALRDRLVASDAAPTWDAYYQPMDDLAERIGRAWSAISNLDATLGTPELRKAHRAAQSILTEFRSRRAQDEAVYRAVLAMHEGADAAGLSAVQKKILADDLRDYRMAGVHLNAEQKARCRAIRAELAQLSSTFSDHVVDDAESFRLVIDDAAKLEGLPPSLVASARQQALTDDAAAPENRWSFNMDQSTVIPFLTYQRDRALREAMQRAWVNRAAHGDSTDEAARARDNSAVALRILTLRQELCGILGFANYAELSLVPKMAETPAQVRAFLLEIADKALPTARKETEEVARLARADGIDTLARHDLGYYRDILRRELHGFSPEELRPYFPLPRVLSGLSQVLSRIYGIALTDRTADGVISTWHKDVRVLEISEDGAALGHILFDPCSRPGKRGGAWVSGLVTRRLLADHSIQRPVAHLVCNFQPALGTNPALLAHDDVRTLFHEFGHALHHVLSTVDHHSVSGTHGVPWDGVEFPSQFHENWIWTTEALALLSGHVDTGEPIPAELVAKLRAARDFFAASDILRQIELAMIDLELHTTFDPAKGDIRATIQSVRERVAVVPAPAWDTMQNAFSHIFAGGYAAGYYGYKWAEVLAADAFGRFEEEGIFSRETGREFRDKVLARGGSADYMELFVSFRGRRPDPAALLRQAGIA